MKILAITGKALGVLTVAYVFVGLAYAMYLSVSP